MNDFEKEFRVAPALEVRAEHEAATVRLALQAFHEQRNRKRVVIPYVSSILGVAAALAFGAFVLLSGRNAPVAESDELLTREMIVQAYVDLRETFPEGLAAVAFVNGEIQIFPGIVGATDVRPCYIEMTLGSTKVQIVAAEGASLPILVNGSNVLIEFVPDGSGEPAVLGENFYWSSQVRFMPSDREVLEARKLEILP